MRLRAQGGGRGESLNPERVPCEETPGHSGAGVCADSTFGNNCNRPEPRDYFLLHVHFKEGFLQLEQTPSLIAAPHLLQGVHPHDWHMIEHPLSYARGPTVSQLIG